MNTRWFVALLILGFALILAGAVATAGPPDGEMKPLSAAGKRSPDSPGFTHTAAD